MNFYSVSASTDASILYQEIKVPSFCKLDHCCKPYGNWRKNTDAHVKSPCSRDGRFSTHLEIGELTGIIQQTIFESEDETDPGGGVCALPPDIAGSVELFPEFHWLSCMKCGYFTCVFCRAASSCPAAQTLLWRTKRARLPCSVRVSTLKFG